MALSFCVDVSLMLSVHNLFTSIGKSFPLSFDSSKHVLRPVIIVKLQTCDRTFVRCVVVCVIVCSSKWPVCHQWHC